MLPPIYHLMCRSPDVEAPASRGGEMVSGRHLRLSGSGSKSPAALYLKTFGLLLLRPSAASSAFGFFGICGDRARRAASSRAASGCATDVPRRAAPHGRVGVRVCATILASSASATSILLPRLLTARRTRRGGRRDGRVASGNAARPCRHVTAPPPIGWLLLDSNTGSSSRSP